MGDQRAHPSYGASANRGCTDIPCVVLFILFWGILAFMASAVFKQGDPNRIFYGMDKYGNNCGHEQKVNLSGLGSDPWASRINIWYPLQFDPTSTAASVDSSISIGVCVRECPKAGTILYGYTDAASSSWFPPMYLVLYDSFPIMHRCFPNVSSVICTSLSNCDSVAHNTLLAAAPLVAAVGETPDPNSTAAPASSNMTTSAEPSSTSATSTVDPATGSSTVAETSTEPQTTSTAAPSTTTTTPAPNAPAPASLSIGGLAAFRDMATDSIDELSESWWVILIGMLISMLLSFGWLFILRRTVKPIVVLTGLVLLVVLILGGGMCFLMRQNSLDDVDSDPETPKYWLAGAIAFWVFAFLFLCVMLYLRKDIMTACDIIEEASKVPIKIPTLATVPVWCFLLVLPFVVWAVYVAIYIQSCGDTLTLKMPNVTIPGAGNISVFNSTAATMELKDWRLPAHLYNVFMFLWSFGVLNAACFMIISLCAVYWYFSVPGDDKSPPDSAVLTAAATVVKNHLGTIFFGAFIVAVIQIIRIILIIVEKRMSDALKKNDAVRGLMAALHCIMACLERAMKFINKNAYIMTAIEGTNFLTSAQRALALLIGNALTVGAITIISEYVMIFGKLLITGLTTLVAFGILKSKSGEDALRSGVLILASCAIVAFFVASLFVNIFSVCIDTILLCYCVDKESSGPHYFPSDLEKHIDKERLRGDAQRALGDGGINKEEPLLPLPTAAEKELDLL